MVIAMLIFKILAAPVVPVLSLLVMVLAFLSSVAAAVLNIVSTVFVVIALFSIFIEKDVGPGVTALVGAFLMSPYGLPALADWLIGKLDGLNESLKGFIAN